MTDTSVIDNIEFSFRLPEVDVLIVNYNTADLIPDALSALHKGAGRLLYRTLVVDNASSDRSRELLDARSDLDLKIFNQHNFGFGRANNQLLPHLRSEFVLLLNTDAFMEPLALEAAVEHLRANPRCGIVGAHLMGRDGELQPSCRYFPTQWGMFVQRMGWQSWFPSARLVDNFEWPHNQVRSCDWVPGCFYLVRRSVLDTIGLFDERFFLYYEEVDHCRRAKSAGWEVHFLPGARVMHIGGASAQTSSSFNARSRQVSALQVESELLYFRKHHGLTGLALQMALIWLATAVQCGKDLARRRPWTVLRRNVDEALLTTRLFLATRMGATPTR
jgi:N-acetylglucosaminyl-diphospho-decaprenol L-rhamnosyltransferase